MKICFPVNEVKGLDSEVYSHFGSAPAFVLVETETGLTSEIANDDQHHEHGMCSPVKALGWHEVDCVVTGGIGAGALMNLGMKGIPVYRAEAGTLRYNLELFKASKLSQYAPTHVCKGHNGGCSH